MVAGRWPPSARATSARCRSRPSSAGSPVTPRRNSAIAVERIGGIQPSRLARSPSLAPRSSRKAGMVMRGQPAVPNDSAELVDHIAERDRLLLHQVPCHGAWASSKSRPASQAMVAAMSSMATGWNGVARSSSGNRAETPPASAAWRCRHRLQARPQSPAARSCERCRKPRSGARLRAWSCRTLCDRLGACRESKYAPGEPRGRCRGSPPAARRNRNARRRVAAGAVL